MLFAFLGRAAGQELNLGIHANPAFTSPIVSSRSQRAEGLHAGPFRLGYNVGANAELQLPSMSIELAANCVGKSVSMYQRAQNVSGGSGYYRVTVPGIGYEVPLLVNYRLHRHDKTSVYDVYAVAGGAAEWFRQEQGISTTVSASGSQSLSVEGGYQGRKTQGLAVAIVGFKIKAVLKNAGLVDYGATFHLPLQATGPYTSTATYASGTASQLFSNRVYVHPSYIDVRLCYYLLNLDRKGKRIRYRGN